MKAKEIKELYKEGEQVTPDAMTLVYDQSNGIWATGLVDVLKLFRLKVLSFKTIPKGDTEYPTGALSINIGNENYTEDIANLKIPFGNGIKELQCLEESFESLGVNTYELIFDDGTKQQFTVKNGKTGVGIDSVTESYYDKDSDSWIDGMNPNSGAESKVTFNKIDHDGNRLEDKDNSVMVKNGNDGWNYFQLKVTTDGHLLVYAQDSEHVPDFEIENGHLIVKYKEQFVQDVGAILPKPQEDGMLLISKNGTWIPASREDVTEMRIVEEWVEVK